MRSDIKQLLDEGWSLVPLIPGKKNPGDDGWLKRVYTADDFDDDRINVGAKCGEPSGWRVDCDLDVKEAAMAADALLPDTGLVQGRTGKPRSHRWFISKNAPSKTYKDLDGTMLLELRATGQTMIPPSIHPSGDEIRWEHDGTPMTLEPEVLVPAVDSVAIAVLLGRHWPAGSRHMAAGAVAGFLARLGISALVIEQIVKVAAQIGGDDEIPDRTRFGRETAEKALKGGVTTGGKRLAEYFEAADKITSLIYRWLGKEDVKVVDDLNEKHFVVLVGTEDVVGSEMDGKYVFQKAASLRLRYANQKVSLGKKTLSLFEVWLESPRRRDYRTVTFAPPPVVPHPRDLNLWRGFAVEPKAGNIDRYLWHAKNIICCGVDEYYDYLIDLMALGVQRPGERSEIATILRGPQGAGKGMFIRAYGEIFGQHFVHLDKPEQLTGKFNAHLSGKVVVFADEAFFAGDKKMNGPLKRLITEPTIQIERKGIDQYQETNCVHLFMATNSEWAVPSEFKERRHFVLDVSEAKAQDHNYFEALAEEIRNGGQAALLHFLLERKIDRKRLRRAPDTAGLRDQQTLTLSAEFKWWRECLHNGAIDDEPWPTWIAASDLHWAYLHWCDRMKVNHRATDVELGKRMKGLLHGSVAERDYTFPRDSQGRRMVGEPKVRKHGWMLAPLAQCQANFDRQMLGPGKRGSWPAIDADAPEDPRESQLDVPWERAS